MSPSVALSVVRPEDLRNSELAAAAVAILEAAALARCSLLPAHSAESKLKFPFSLAGTSRFTAESATQRNPDNTN